MNVQKYPVLSLCAFDGYIHLQEKIENTFQLKKYTVLNVRQDSRRKHTFNPKSHILIEVMSLPKGIINYLHTLQLLYITKILKKNWLTYLYFVELEASTSYADITEICNVPQNYAKPVLWDLEEIPKILIINNKNQRILFKKCNRICKWGSLWSKSIHWTL